MERRSRIVLFRVMVALMLIECFNIEHFRFHCKQEQNDFHFFDFKVAGARFKKDL